MDFKEVAIAAAKEAGKAVLELSQQKVKYSMKGMFDILAEGDLKAEEIIVRHIKAAFPGHSILSEELGEDGKGSEYLWVIDPIDGTINYSRGIEDYCVSIALEHRSELVLGVLYQPTLDKLYVAEKGKGAFLNGKRVKVSEENSLINMLVGTDNSSKVERRMKICEILMKFWKQVRHVRIFGSGALDAAKVASGNIDIYYKVGFNYWDYAAAIVLVREAGGRVTDMEGKEVTRHSKGILATNGKVHEEVLRLLNR